RLISDAKPCSRHLLGMSINLQVTGSLPVSVASYSGDSVTVYPYTPELISVGGTAWQGGTVHIIDEVKVNA
ncbi:hypothetical protein BX596_4323, partial [Enterobacteriaceae bacterium JKS000233]